MFLSGSGVISRTILLHNSDLMEISFCSHPSSCEVVAMKFCTWYDSFTAMAIFFRNIVPYNGDRLKTNICWIWNSMENSFVYWEQFYWKIFLSEFIYIKILYALFHCQPTDDYNLVHTYSNGEIMSYLKFSNDQNWDENRIKFLINLSLHGKKCPWNGLLG